MISRRKCTAKNCKNKKNLGQAYQRLIKGIFVDARRKVRLGNQGRIYGVFSVPAGPLWLLSSFKTGTPVTKSAKVGSLLEMDF